MKLICLDAPARDRRENENDNYEIKVTLNKPLYNQGTSSSNVPPQQPFPPRDPYQQDFYPPRVPYPHYEGPQHFSRGPYDNYQGRSGNMPRPNQNLRPPQSRPPYNANNRGRGGFRGGRGQITSTQKFKNVSPKKKNTNVGSNFESDSD